MVEVAPSQCQYTLIHHDFNVGYLISRLPLTPSRADSSIPLFPLVDRDRLEVNFRGEDMA